MAKEKALKLNLYIIEEKRFLGPTELGTFENHPPRLLVEAPQVFEAEQGNYLVFRVKTNDFVDLDQTYNQIGIKENEAIIMTKVYDPEAVSLFSKVFISAEDPESIIDKIPKIEIEVPLGSTVIRTDAVAWLRLLYEHFKSR